MEALPSFNLTDVEKRANVDLMEKTTNIGRPVQITTRNPAEFLGRTGEVRFDKNENGAYGIYFSDISTGVNTLYFKEDELIFMDDPANQQRYKITELSTGKFKWRVEQTAPAKFIGDYWDFDTLERAQDWCKNGIIEKIDTNCTYGVLKEMQNKPAECKDGCPENQVCDDCAYDAEIKHFEQGELHAIMEISEQANACTDAHREALICLFDLAGYTTEYIKGAVDYVPANNTGCGPYCPNRGEYANPDCTCDKEPDNPKKCGPCTNDQNHVCEAITTLDVYLIMAYDTDGSLVVFEGSSDLDVLKDNYTDPDGDEWIVKVPLPYQKMVDSQPDPLPVVELM